MAHRCSSARAQAIVGPTAYCTSSKELYVSVTCLMTHSLFHSPATDVTGWKRNRGRTVLQGGSWEPNGSVCPGEVWRGRGR